MNLSFEELTRREHELKKFFVLETTRNKWRKVVPLLGLIPDKILAKRINVSIQMICTVRSTMRIAPISFPTMCNRYGAKYEPM